jgi:hypothetical protein
MKNSITLDIPFIEQQEFQEFLNLSPDENITKVSFRKLLILVQNIIQEKLIEYGYSQDELVKIEIKYQLVDKEQEVYYIGWVAQKQDGKNQPDEAKLKVIDEESPKITAQPLLILNSNHHGNTEDKINEFVSKLTERIDEVFALEKAVSISNNIEFRTLRSHNCIKGICHQGFLAEYCNGEFKRYQRDGLGNKRPC